MNNIIQAHPQTTPALFMHEGVWVDEDSLATVRAELTESAAAGDYSLLPLYLIHKKQAEFKPFWEAVTAIREGFVQGRSDAEIMQLVARLVGVDKAVISMTTMYIPCGVLHEIANMKEAS